MKIKTCLYKPTGHWKSFCTVSIQLFQQCCSVILNSPYQPAVEYEQADVSTADNVRMYLFCNWLEWCNKNRCISGASVSRKTQ
ncbi:hypothetical protein T4B_14494, partial [Trichinella pseudospiralis]